MKWIAWTLAGISITATLAAAGERADGRGRDRAAAVRDGGDREHGVRGQGLRPRDRLRHRHADARHVLRDLNLSPAQRDLARREAEALRPAAQALRDEARAIVAAARARARDSDGDGDRAGARTQARDALRELRTRARTEFTPAGRALVASLTPEQRAHIEARLAARGRTFDVERASERVGRRLARLGAGGRGSRAPQTR